MEFTYSVCGDDSPRPENFILNDVFHVSRWMCSNCGLVFDYQFEPGEFGWPQLGWPRFDDVGDQWVDEDGAYHCEVLGQKTLCPRCGSDFDGVSLIPVKVIQMVSPSDLDELVQQGEGRTLEFKAALPHDKTLCKEIAAFATSEGGTILLGVNDDGQKVGLPDLDNPAGKDNLQKHIYDLVSRIEPKVRVVVDFFSDGEGLNVAMITVPKGPRAIYTTDHKVYIRELSRSRPASAEEIENLIERHRRRRLGVGKESG